MSKTVTAIITGIALLLLGLTVRYVSGKMFKEPIVSSTVHSYDTTSNSDTLFYPNGAIKQVHIEASLTNLYETYISFNEKGQKIKVEEQTTIAGCGVLAELKEWNDAGRMIRFYYYDYFFLNGDSSCHDIRTVIEKQDYYDNGQLAKTSFTETCYECDECPCNNLTEYDTLGKMIFHANFGNCFDGQLNCLEE